ncbi:MAG: rhodanese-related sulfurtransferase [Pseudomonadota bacterium]
MTHLVAALYKFAPIADPAALRARLAPVAAEAGLVGSLLIAPEGVNGTISGRESPLRAFLDRLRAETPLRDLRWKESWAAEAPFGRLKIRLKREIVSMGAPGIVSAETVGAYVEPEDWNEAISAPGVVVIDVRNDYEVAIGRFEGAVDPKTQSFRAFPDWAAAAAELSGRPTVAMYCTGGIRCEKASAHLRAQGFERVLHLKGGILEYLERVPEAQSLWRGDCFVFDERVSVGHGLAPGSLSLCRGCRRPLSAEDRARPDYAPGVSCRWCAAETSPDKARARQERRRQMRLSAARGERHLGPRSA